MKITTNADEVSQHFAVTEKQLTIVVRNIIRSTAVDMRSRIVKNASYATRKDGKVVKRFDAGGLGASLDGPRVVTGNYRRSIQVNHERVGDTYVSVISTNAPYARRLEYGFRGADSRGRVYNQRPRPHWQPVVDKQQEFFKQAVATAIRKVLYGPVKKKGSSDDSGE